MPFGFDVRLKMSRSATRQLVEKIKSKYAEGKVEYGLGPARRFVKTRSHLIDILVTCQPAYGHAMPAR